MSAPNPFDCPQCVDTFVGPAVRVGGPTCCQYDSPFTATLTGDLVIRGYSANQISSLVAALDTTNNTSSPTLNGAPNSSVFLASPAEVGLGHGPNATDLDACGSWLNSVHFEPETGLVRGFYHEEWECDYANHSYTNKSIAYAESTDGGRTFVKFGYPHNQIILPQVGNTTTAHQTGV